MKYLPDDCFPLRAMREVTPQRVAPCVMYGYVEVLPSKVQKGTESVCMPRAALRPGRLNGGTGGIRTRGRRIMSPLLSPLSYRPRESR